MAELQDGTLDFEARLTLVSIDVRKLQEQPRSPAYKQNATCLKRRSRGIIAWPVYPG